MPPGLVFSPKGNLGMHKAISGAFSYANEQISSPAEFDIDMKTL